MSSQGYDIKTTDEFSDRGPNGTKRANTGFDYTTGNVVIGLFTGAGMSAIAHEFKHAYQFETGEYSVGPIIQTAEYPTLLYDRFDEVQAYEREALFGGRKYGMQDLPDDYSEIVTEGPVSATSHPQFGMIIKSTTLEFQKKYFQGIADQLGYAFRINGITYYNHK